MQDERQKLGWELMECSRENEEFSAQRGLINELFPFIYEASKRMSSRAISRWLAANNVKLSAVTIAKALRNPKPYWQELLEEMEAPARIVATAYRCEVNDLMGSQELYESLAKKTATVDAVTREGASNSFHEIQGATNAIQKKWFSLPESIREACLANADLELEEDSLPEVKPKDGAAVIEAAAAKGTATEAAATQGAPADGAAAK
jgi:hypothetical protein